MTECFSQNGSTPLNWGSINKHPQSKTMGQGSLVLKIYSLFIMMADISILIVQVLLIMMKSLYYAIVGEEEKSVKDEIVLITGTGHGIGKELAMQFGALGATLVCWDINDENNAGTMKELKEIGYKAFSYKCDVANRDEVMEVAKKVKAEVGDVTILVNNAGIMPCHPLLQHNPQEIKKIFDINVLAHFWMLEAFLPSMITNNHGHIIALSSMAGQMGLANLVPYCSSKYAVRGLMEAMAEELRSNGRNSLVRFTTICPYIVDTGLCKKPFTRFPSLMPFVPPKIAAKKIIHAMRTDKTEVTIPAFLLGLTSVGRLLPVKATLLIKDFLDSGVESDFL